MFFVYVAFYETQSRVSAIKREPKKRLKHVFKVEKRPFLSFSTHVFMRNFLAGFLEKQKKAN